MPNWCNNTIQVQGPKDKILKLKEAVVSGKMLDHMMPMPEELKDSEKYPANGTDRKHLLDLYGASDWYHWAVNNWGTKWDTGVDDESYITFKHELLGKEDGWSEITFSFDSAWSPPIGAYEHYLNENEDVSIRATYYEPGCDFTGVWEDHDDICYTLSELSDSFFINDKLGQELDELYGILESREQYREEEESATEEVAQG